MGSTRVSRFILVAAAVACLTASAAFAADPIQAGDVIHFFDGPGASPGGEFQVTKTPTNTATWLFSTFCVQNTEYMQFYPAYQGGFNVVGITDHVVLGNTSLSPKAAYLYTQFRSGTYSLFDYVNPTQRNTDATLLQQAIWNYQGIGSYSNKYTTDADAANWTGIGSVRVMNLTWAASYNNNQFKAGDNAQDVLTIVPVPEPVFLQFGVLSGLGGFALWRRRR